MALISCPGCKGQVSDNAPRCPHCGKRASSISQTNTEGTTPLKRIGGIIYKAFDEITDLIFWGIVAVAVVGGGIWLFTKGPLAKKDDANKQYLETVHRTLDRSTSGKKGASKDAMISALKAAASDIDSVPTANVEPEVVAWGRANASILRRTAGLLDHWFPDEGEFNALKPEMESLDTEYRRLLKKYE